MVERGQKRVIAALHKEAEKLEQKMTDSKETRPIVGKCPNDNLSVESKLYDTLFGE